MNKEKNKINFKVIGAIFIIITLYTIGLLPFNYCTDYYNLIMDGYIKFGNYWFAAYGRTVGIMVMYLFDYLKIHVDVYIFIMKVFSIFIATCTVYIFSNMCFNKLKNSNIYQRIIIIIASLITFLNIGSYQYFYYAESAIMWLGVLLTVIAVKYTINENDKFRYVKSFILLFLAMNCYQATILLYIPMMILFIGIEKKTIKNIIIDTSKLMILVAICLLSGYAIIKGLNNYFDIIPYRNIEISFNLDTFYNAIINMMFLNFFKEEPKLIYIFVYSFCLILSIVLNKNCFRTKKSNAIFSLFLMIISAFTQIVSLVTILDFYMADRIVFSYVSLLGLCVIYLIFYTDIMDSKLIAEYIIFLLILFLISVIYNSNYISILNRAARYLDEIEASAIVSEIEKNEEQYNCIISKVVYCVDDDGNYDWPNLKVSGDPTFRLFASDWVLKNVIEYYSGNIIESCESDPNVYNSVFNNKNWNEFSLEQIVFDNETMYICIY